MSLAKVTFIKSVKVHRYGLRLCGSMLYQVYGSVCAVQSVHSAQHTAHTLAWTWYNMLPHNRIVHDYVLLLI